MDLASWGTEGWRGKWTLIFLEEPEAGDVYVRVFLRMESILGGMRLHGGLGLKR